MFVEAAVTGYWAPCDPWLSELPVWENPVSAVTPVSLAGGLKGHRSLYTVVPSGLLGTPGRPRGAEKSREGQTGCQAEVLRPSGARVGTGQALANFQGLVFP